MFDIFAKILSSIASFLFPLFASYKALKTSDPAELTPWLMYWVVLACALLVESWTEWFLVWIPFYAYLRFLFLLYLVLPQTQGARIIYQTYVHPYLEENETAIEDFIASAHHRLKQAGISYLKRAIELLKTNVLGLPPSSDTQSQASAASATSGTPQSYTQTLLARFSLPAARWTGAGIGQTTSGATDFYSLLASAVSAATGSTSAGESDAPRGAGGMEASGILIPDNIQGSAEKMTFIAAQREKLSLLMSALDREATQLKTEDETTKAWQAPDVGLDGAGPDDNLPSNLSKSRSEAEFEKLEAMSGDEEHLGIDSGSAARKRPAAASKQSTGWASWVWGSGGTKPAESGTSSGVEK
jgi:hypothetical protein